MSEIIYTNYGPKYRCKAAPNIIRKISGQLKIWDFPISDVLDPPPLFDFCANLKWPILTF